MKATRLLVLLLLLAATFSAQAALWAQTDTADLEVDLNATQTDPAAAAPAPGIICRNGHWIRSAPGYPPVCTIQHVDNVIGPLAPCSRIIIGGRPYHIVAIQTTTTGRLLITVRRLF